MSNDRFFVKMEGFEDVAKELQNLGRTGSRHFSKALKAGGEVFLNLAISKAPYSNRKSSRHIRTAIDVSNIKTDLIGEPYVSVGTYIGGGKYRNDVYWAHIVEGGHRIVTKGKKKTVGWVAAKPFMQPAFEQGQKQAGDVMIDMIAKGMRLSK